MYQIVNRFRDLFFRFLLFIILFFFGRTYAQEVTFTLIHSTAEEVVIRVDFPAYQTIPVEVNGVMMNKLQINGAYAIPDAGAPELLEAAVSLIIPDNCSPTAEIINSDCQLLTGFALAPSKGRLLRTVNPDSIAYRQSEVYAENRFLYNDSILIGTPYQLRDYQGIALHFHPFAYNPVQKTLKVYTSITARIRFHGTLTGTRAKKLNVPFDALYAAHFLNYAQVKSAQLIENGDILILAPDNFCAALQPYADWKIKTGYPTEIVPLSTTGNTSSAVKNYIASYYNQHNLAFVLIVGDDGQFPVIKVGGNISDNYYAEIAGNDHYPDVILGKISAETVEQINTQITRFIEYEQNPAETAHFPVYCGISSNEGPGYNNEYDHEHIRNLGTMLSAYTYTSGYEIFDGSQGGMDAPGNATATLVKNAINAGVGIINYCGHGADTYWVTSNFSVSNVNSLTNEGKLPIILSVACVNGNYKGQTCFAEAWLRATHNNRPTGAAGALMSTINQPWDSPMCAQEEMIRYLTGHGNYTKMNTFGAVVFNGLIKMLDNYDDYEVSRTWILFGDPALFVRTTIPQPLTLNYADACPLGTNSLTFYSPVENAKVTLSCRNQVLAVGLINGGTVTLALPDTLSVTDTLCVTGTALHYLPATGQINLFFNQGPYLVCNSVTLHDNGNNDALADYGETVVIDPVFTNVGMEDATNVIIKFRTQDPYITILDSVLHINELNTYQSNTFPSAFKIRIADNVPAAHEARLVLHISYNDRLTQDNNLILILHAPTPDIQNLLINDVALGNGNLRLDSNETADLVITLKNTGNGDAAAGLVSITNPENNLYIFRHGNVIPALAQGATQTTVFRVQVENSISMPTFATLHIIYKTDQYTASKDVTLKIGVIEEDWESNSFTSLDWVNNSGKPWKTTTQDVYEGQYAARSGAIGNNTSSILSITHENNAPDTLSFYYYVSSEASYDFLKFYIDGSLKEKWSGEVPWSRAAYIVPAGRHTYKWEYVKDYYMKSGKDLAMLDNIYFPCLNPASVGMEEHPDFAVSLMPNPTSDNIRLVIQNTVDLSQIFCLIYDINGKLLRTEAITSPTTDIFLTDLARGLYIFKIRNNNATLKTFKVVKY